MQVPPRLRAWRSRRTDPDQGQSRVACPEDPHTLQSSSRSRLCIRGSLFSWHHLYICGGGGGGAGAAAPSAPGGGGGGPAGPRLSAGPLGRSPGEGGAGGATAAAGPPTGVGGWLANSVWPFSVTLCASKLVCPAMTLFVPLTWTRAPRTIEACSRAPRSGGTLTATPLRSASA